MRRFKQFLALGLAAGVVLGMCVFFAFQTVMKQRVAETRAQVRKPQAMMFYEELRAPEGEDSSGQEDAAGAPAPEPAAPEREYAEETMARYAKLFAWSEKRPEAVETWVDLLNGVLEKDIGQWSADERARLEAFFSANQDLILEIRELAERGGPVYPLDFSRGFNLELPHLAQMRDFARLLSGDAIVKALNGHYEETVADLVAGMKLADAVSEEPILISQLVGIAMDGIVCATYPRIFEGGELPQDLARELVRQAAQSQGREAFADSFLGEQYMGLDVFAQLQESDWLTGIDVLGGNSGFPSSGLPALLYTSPLARPWRYMDEQAYAETMGSFADATRLPYYEARPLLEQLADDIEDLPRTRLLSRTLLPALARSALAQARREATLDMLQIGIMLEQQFAQRGEYPAMLDAIAGDLGGTVPVDPFSGEPYHYEVQGGTFVLYSVGMNLTDDGGRPSFREDGSRNQFEGDMVWRGEKRQPVKVASQAN